MFRSEIIRDMFWTDYYLYRARVVGRFYIMEKVCNKRNVYCNNKEK